jgi:hypothetical protein
MKDRWRRRKIVLENLNSGPWDAKYYVGWRGKLRHAIQSIRETIESWT